MGGANEGVGGAGSGDGDGRAGNDGTLGIGDHAGNHREPGKQAQRADGQHESIAPAQPAQIRIGAVRLVVKGKSEQSSIALIAAQNDAVSGVH